MQCFTQWFALLQCGKSGKLPTRPSASLLEALIYHAQIEVDFPLSYPNASQTFRSHWQVLLYDITHRLFAVSRLPWVRPNELRLQTVLGGGSWDEERLLAVTVALDMAPDLPMRARRLLPGADPEG